MDIAAILNQPSVALDDAGTDTAQYLRLSSRIARVAALFAQFASELMPESGLTGAVQSEDAVNHSAQPHARSSNVEALRSGDGVHGSLWFYTMYQPTNGEDSGEEKSRHISRLSVLPLPDGYREAFDRRHESLRGVEWIDLHFPRRLAVGAGALGPAGIGLTLESTWGVPVIPGSSLKGAARAFCEELLDPDWAAPDGQYFGQLFGSGTGGVGAVVFHDAWLVPNPSLTTMPIQQDVRTPHHHPYLSWTQEPEDPTKGTVRDETAVPREPPPPLGLNDPVPVPFPVVVNAVFRVWIGGSENWRSAARQLLVPAIAQRGLGSRAQAGYGRAHELPLAQPSRGH